MSRKSRTVCGGDEGTPLVVVACPGAGLVRRGYESFAIQLAAQLQTRPELNAILLTGGAVPAEWARKVPTLSRFGRLARLATQTFRVPATLVEQVTFGLASVARLARLRPDTVLVSERGLGALYHRLRESPLGRLLRFHPTLVLSNGGGSPAPYAHFDVVQHVTPETYEAALAAGEPPHKHVCLPYGFETPERAARKRPALDETGRPPVIISVGNLDFSRKRMDHVIREVARLERPSHLILLGQESDDETPALRTMARTLLRPSSFEIASVTPEEVGDFYERADVFTLASLDEAFGRVYVEAMMHGLPCVVHDFPVARFVLGSDGIFVDMTVDGQLARALEEVLAGNPGDGNRRREAAVVRFAWESLMPRYVALLTTPSLS